ncbi:hypothetical protein ABZ412_34800 [Nocardia sp. NPDC005746]|uniref:hypothetical protein n=1 Tax=unclassified Nocardia TaxID=2637762 RepID=UPI003401CDED
MKRSLTITAVAAALALGAAGTATAAPLTLEPAAPVAATNTGSSALTGSSEVLGQLALVPGLLATMIACELSSMSGQMPPPSCIW